MGRENLIEGNRLQCGRLNAAACGNISLGGACLPVIRLRSGTGVFYFEGFTAGNLRYIKNRQPAAAFLAGRRIFAAGEKVYAVVGPAVIVFAHAVNCLQTDENFIGYSKRAVDGLLEI